MASLGLLAGLGAATVGLVLALGWLVLRQERPW